MPVDLFSVKAPLLIRLPTGERRVIAEVFPHPMGLLYFDLYWHDAEPETAIHVVEGEIRGDGPWKVGSCVISVLGCHNTDPEAADYAAWQDYLAQHGEKKYPPRQMVRAIARWLGASV